MEFYKVEIKNQEDVDFVSLMIISLDSIKKHYTPENDYIKYDKETKDLDLFGMVTNAATCWSDNFLINLKELAAGHLKEILITEREFHYIKYITEAYFDYVGDNLGRYSKIDIVGKFKSVENKSKSKNILKIVK